MKVSRLVLRVSIIGILVILGITGGVTAVLALGGQSLPAASPGTGFTY